MQRRFLLALLAWLSCGLIGPAGASVPAVPLATLAQSCAPDTAPRTLMLVAAQESGGVPWAIHVNGPYRLPRPPASLAEATATVRWLAAHGHDFDTGLLQINSRNATRLGLDPAALLEPCRNLRVASLILHQCYRAALPGGASPQAALRHALSCYNTGSLTRGLRNGYVDGLLARAAQPTGSTTLMIPVLEAPPAPSDDAPTPPPQAPQPASPPGHDPQGDDAPGQDAFTHAPRDVFTPRAAPRD
ncbi:lytic transglycosylase domain-containing protein [Komagataeibacter xylinus]|uniref:lytic transglycosylase domain-containing protein n=1 Tax=Komagataeibacter xylinus TaxID=28448 RepID=UPI000FDF8C3D|nr:lytic transglycosylase domain-containing protein [Komagataeibacter xylinus]AZV38930.1 traL protein [Komagataeibacter xylinus]